MTELDTFFNYFSGGSRFQPVIHGIEPVASPEVQSVIDAAGFAINRIVRSEEDRRALFDEGRINNGEEGTGIPILMGPRNSVKGQWLYLTDYLARFSEIGELIGEALLSFLSGQGLGIEDLELKYDIVFAMSAGRAANNKATKGVQIERVFANGKEVWNQLLFSSFGKVVVTGSDITVTDTVSGNRNTMTLTVPQGSTTDLLSFYPTVLSGISMVGFTNATENDSDWALGSQNNTIVGQGVNDDGSVFIELIDVDDSVVAETAGASVVLTQEFVDLETFLSGHIWVKPPTVLLGGSNPSLPDKFDGFNNEPVSFDAFLKYADGLSTLLGTIPSHPSYKKLVWFFGRMATTQFNNSIPEIRLEAKEITANPNNAKFLGDAVSDILNLAGYQSCEYDTSMVTGTLRGYTIYPPMNGERALQPIMEGYNLVSYEDHGQLVFINRGNEDIVVIEPDKVSAHEPGSDAPRPLLVTQETDFEQPTSVTVKYKDSTLDLRTSTETTRRHNVTGADKVLEVDLPLALTPDEAKSVSERILWNAWQNSTKVTFHLPPRYLWLREQHKVQLTSGGRTYNVIVTNIEEGNNFLLEVTGYIESFSPFVDVLSGSEPFQGPGGGIYLPPFLELFFHDIAPMARSHADVIDPKSGFYAMTAALDTDAEYRGAKLLCNTIDTADENYALCSAFPSEATSGFSTDVLADPPVQTTGLWDRNGVVTIKLIHGSLALQTQTPILSAWGSIHGFADSGANIARLGTEIIAFQQAAAQGDGVYTLRILLRGLRNTMDVSTGHASGEEFHLVTNPVNTKLVQFSQEEYLGLVDARLKVLADGADFAGVTAEEITFTHGLRNPFSVASLQGFRGYNKHDTTADTDDINVVWFPRVIGFMQQFGQWYRDEHDPSNGVETYTVIWRADDTNKTILDTDVLTFTPTGLDPAYKGYRQVTWTEAQQSVTAVTALGHSLGDPVVVDVFKTSIGLNGKITQITVA